MIEEFLKVKDLNKVGNKAKSLIELKKNRFNVPDGIVIDKDTYIETIKPIKNKISDVLKSLSQDNIDISTQKINSLFEEIKFEESFIKKINDFLDDNKTYAVRSSGTKEDLESLSFAGQYSTFLNVNKKDVPQRIIDCYKSMFSNTILSYYLKNSISFEDAAMSVIVQEMVDSDYSGICFTVNPFSGKDKEMLIEVGEGLGENIVSGKNRPEQYTYNWIEDTYDYDNSNKYLNNDILKEISKVFFDIHYFYGFPCDIEFAIKDNKLYILQSRRITKIQYNSYDDMWSTADFKDGGVSATICYPYMWSLYEYIWEYTLRKFLLDSKILSKKEVDRKLGDMFFARPYWNLSVVKLAMSKIVGYKEREFDSEFGVARNYEGDGATTKVSLKSLLKIITIAIEQTKIVKTREKNAEKLKSDLLNKYYEFKNEYDSNIIEDVKSKWYSLTHDDYLKSESTYFWQIFINTVHQSLYKDSLLKYVSESEYLKLLGGIDDISHLRPFYKMWNISRIIRSNKELSSYWKSKSIEEIKNDLEKNSSREDFSQIISLVNDFGYHSDKELDVSYFCYYEDISPILTSIRDMISLDDKYSPEADKKLAQKEYEKVLNKIKESSKESKFSKVKNKILKMRKMLWWREEFRDVSTRFYYLIRVYTLKLAEKLKEEKAIDEIEDIWFLKVGDLWSYLDNKEIDLKEIIQKNKKYYYAYKNYMSENEIGKIFSEATNTSNKKSDIVGLGANSGVVTGRARVIQDFSEIDKIEKNDILITKFTDTGWTPKFAILSGIVTEYGGILCHAAIVSREYGIPAIVNCKDVMNKIKDGQTITIDGAKGTVRIND